MIMNNTEATLRSGMVNDDVRAAGSGQTPHATAGILDTRLLAAVAVDTDTSKLGRVFATASRIRPP